ncbi:hypothetical protein [Embleya sp. NPDC020886]|uniref:hypothetical protein n=1 Tax=Embleya sp. NPDC020886 TaxID=3363980 RepID=UPI0037A1F2B9
MSTQSEPPHDGSARADHVPDHHRGSRAGRIAMSIVSAVLITLTCVLVPVSLITVWVHDIVLNTDRYVSTVAPLASNPAIEAAIADRITEAVDVRVDGKQVTSDLAAWLESQGLPPRVGNAVKSLAPQLDDAATQAAHKAATRFAQSDRFETVWKSANRTAHSALDHALTGKGRGAVGVDEGTVTLDVGAAVDSVKQDLVNAGVSPADKIPDVDKQMVLVQSDKLKKFRNAAHALDVLGNWLPIIAVVLGAIGVLLARRRRRALVTTALGAAFGCLVVAIALVIARRFYLDHLPAQVQSPAAASAIFDTLLRFLKNSLRTGIVLGLVVAIGAYLSGPGRLPLALRGSMERAADSVARWADTHGLHTGRTGTWVAAHRRWLAIGALLVIALWFALWNHPTGLTILLLVVVLLVLLAIIALLAATGRTTLSRTQTTNGRPGPVGGGMP